MYSEKRNTNVGLNIFVGEKCANIDYKYGPYASLEEAQAYLGDQLDVITVGLTVGISDGTNVKEYWWQGGTTLDCLVEKAQGEGGAVTPGTGTTGTDQQITSLSTPASNWNTTSMRLQVAQNNGAQANTKYVDVPSATETKAGLMSSNSVKDLSDLKTRVSTLELGGGAQPGTLVVSGAVYFETLALMKASKALHVGDVVITKGYRWAGDGGGATYIVKSADDATLKSWLTATWQPVYDSKISFVDGVTLIAMTLDGGSTGYAEMQLVNDSVDFRQLGGMSTQMVSQKYTLDGKSKITTYGCDDFDNEPIANVYLTLKIRLCKRVKLLIPSGVWLFSETDWVPMAPSNNKSAHTRDMGSYIEGVTWHASGKYGYGASGTTIMGIRENQDYIWRFGHATGRVVCPADMNGWSRPVAYHDIDDMAALKFDKYYKVSRNNVLYSANTSVSNAETWNEAHWTKVSLTAGTKLWFKGKLYKTTKAVAAGEALTSSSITTSGLYTQRYTENDAITQRNVILNINVTSDGHKYGFVDSGLALHKAYDGIVIEQAQHNYIDGLYVGNFAGTGVCAGDCWETYWGYCNLRQTGRIDNGNVFPPFWFSTNSTTSSVSANYFYYWNIEGCLGSIFYSTTDVTHCEWNDIQVEGSLYTRDNTIYNDGFLDKNVASASGYKHPNEIGDHDESDIVVKWHLFEGKYYLENVINSISITRFDNWTTYKNPNTNEYKIFRQFAPFGLEKTSNKYYNFAVGNIIATGGSAAGDDLAVFEDSTGGEGTFAASFSCGNMKCGNMVPVHAEKSVKVKIPATPKGLGGMSGYEYSINNRGAALWTDETGAATSQNCLCAADSMLFPWNSSKRYVLRGKPYVKDGSVAATLQGSNPVMKISLGSDSGVKLSNIRWSGTDDTPGYINYLRGSDIERNIVSVAADVKKGTAYTSASTSTDLYGESDGTGMMKFVLPEMESNGTLMNVIKKKMMFDSVEEVEVQTVGLSTSKPNGVQYLVGDVFFAADTKTTFKCTKRAMSDVATITVNGYDTVRTMITASFAGTGNRTFVFFIDGQTSAAGAAAAIGKMLLYHGYSCVVDGNVIKVSMGNCGQTVGQWTISMTACKFSAAESKYTVAGNLSIATSVAAGNKTVWTTLA